MKKEINYIQLNTNRHAKVRMRKYYRAILLITAVISLISLLFYRHEYNRLRYVLEVVNYFGQPNQEGSLKKTTLGLNEPLSSWQRLDDDLYVYTSYVINKGKIQTISYGQLNNLNLNCFIFFEDLLTPIPGIFSFSVIGNTSDVPGKTAYKEYLLACGYGEHGHPVGVSYQQKDQVLFSTNTPILPVKVQAMSMASNGSAICIAPPLSIPISRTEMISFLNFHELIGMNNFIVYDYGIPNSFHKALKSMADESHQSWNFTYEVVPWNFPIRGILPNVIRNIIESDCLHRTYNKVLFAATVSWEEYIVLKYHLLVLDLLKEFERSKMYADRYMIQSQTFCTQQKNDKKSTNSTPIILRKKYISPNALNANYLYIYKPNQSMDLQNIKTLKISADLMILNRYVSCNDYNPNNPETNKYEPSILRFAGYVLNSPIFQKFITGKLFDS